MNLEEAEKFRQQKRIEPDIAASKVSVEKETP